MNVFCSEKYSKETTRIVAMYSDISESIATGYFVVKKRTEKGLGKLPLPQAVNPDKRVIVQAGKPAGRQRGQLLPFSSSL